MGKKGQTEKQAAAETRTNASMDTKRARRAAQSERDSEAARSAEGFIPSKRVKDLVEFKHRCPKCLNPSAAVRRGALNCVRCRGSAQRSRERNAALKKIGQPQAAM